MSLLTTRQVAVLWKCSPDSARYYLRSAGVIPLQGDTTMYEGRTLYWRADDVARVQGERNTSTAKPPTTKELRKMNADAAARRALKREQQRERWAKYWRAKAEARAAAKQAAKVGKAPVQG